MDQSESLSADSDIGESQARKHSFYPDDGISNYSDRERSQSPKALAPDFSIKALKAKGMTQRHTQLLAHDPSPRRVSNICAFGGSDNLAEKLKSRKFASQQFGNTSMLAKPSPFSPKKVGEPILGQKSSKFQDQAEYAAQRISHVDEALKIHRKKQRDSRRGTNMSLGSQDSEGMGSDFCFDFIDKNSNQNNVGRRCIETPDPLNKVATDDFSGLCQEYL